MLALQLRQVLGDSGPRRADEIGNVLMAERCSQQRTARVLDSEVGGQFEQREGDAFVKPEVEKTRAAQQQPVALLQIVVMKFLEDRFRAVRGETFEIAPAQTADSAIMVSLAAKIEPAKWQRRKFGDRTRRQQGDGHPLAAGVLASDARDAFQQDVSVGCERGFTKHYLRPSEVGERKRSRQQS
jgi:hypothetical protein